MDSSFDIFPSQSSTDSHCGVQQCDINKIFPQAVYCCSNVDKSLWVLCLDNFGWKLLRSNRRSSQLSKEDFLQCCSIPLDSFVQEKMNVDSDPFSSDFGSTGLPHPVIHLISSEASHDIRIMPSLFRQLFRRESVLSATTTHPAYPCLLGLTDGRVLFWHPVTAKVPHLICHMYQPVVDILSGPEGSLLCVGQQGKVICIRSGKEKAEFSLVFLHGPVMSCCQSGKDIFHTTSSYHLWRSSIEFDNDGQVNITQVRVPVSSAKRVQSEPMTSKVTYITEDNVLSNVPPESLSVDPVSQHQKLHWLSDKIAEQSKRALQLSQHTEKFSSLFHDLTCAAWLLTPDKCGLKCQCEVLPVPGRESTFNLRIMFSELGKLCPSSLWSVCSSVGQKLGSTETKLTQTVPIYSDIVYVDLVVQVCLGPKAKSWGSHLRLPLNVECIVLFGGVPVNPLFASRPCPAMKFALQSFVLDEFSFLTEKNFNKSHQMDSVDNIILNIAKQKGRQQEMDKTLSLPGKVQCSLKALMLADGSAQDMEELVWRKVLPENLRDRNPKIFSLLGHEVKLWTATPSRSADEARHLSLFIETDCPSLLAGLRTSAVSRIKDLYEGANVEVSVTREAMNKAQALLSELQILKNSQSFDKALQFYLKLRNEFSSNLLLV